MGVIAECYSLTVIIINIIILTFGIKDPEGLTKISRKLSEWQLLNYFLKHKGIM